MTRTAVVVAALASALLLPPVADAKDARSGRVCGREACVRIESANLRRLLLEAGPDAPAPSHRVAFYRARLSMGVPAETFGFVRLVLLPARGLVASDDGRWMRLRPDAQRGYRRLTADLRPFPAGDLPLAAVPPTPLREDPPARERATDEDDGMSPVVPAALVVAALGAVGAIVVRRRAGPHAV